MGTAILKINPVIVNIFNNIQYISQYMPDVYPSRSEAINLITTPKIRADNTNHFFPPLGVTINIPLKSENREIDFLLDIESKSITLHGVKYQTRVYKDVILTRLDFGPKPHWNPNGLYVPGPHIHIYEEGFHDKIAHPLPYRQFLRTDNRMMALEKFMDFCNIVERPIIREGLSND